MENSFLSMCRGGKGKSEQSWSAAQSKIPGNSEQNTNFSFFWA